MEDKEVYEMEEENYSIFEKIKKDILNGDYSVYSA